MTLLLYIFVCHKAQIMIDNFRKHYKSQKDSYTFSVLIPTWNNLNYLKLCISSIRKNSHLDIQLIIFVNEGRDGTREWLNEQSDIDYIISDTNVGICYALNMCRSMVKSDYIIYINDDMYVLPGWDTELKKEISQLATKSFILSSTLIEPTDTGNPCVIVKNYGDSTETFNETGLLMEYNRFPVCDWNGSTWPPTVVHRDVWDLVGGLSVEFSPGMYSDPDFSKKLYDSGVRVFKGVGKSMVYHFGSKSTRKLKKSKGKGLFLLKWGLTSNIFCETILDRGGPYRVLTDKPDRKNRTLVSKFKLFKLLLNSDIHT